MTQRLTLLSILIMALSLLTACDVSGGQEIIVEMEVTRVVVVTATPSADDSDTPEAQSGPLPVSSLAPSPEATVDAEATADAEASEEPTEEATEEVASITATPDAFPEPIIGQILVAEQTFQNGKMFWLEPIDQIWVTTTNDEGEQVWINRADNFEEGMPESDPSLEPPAEGLFQPIRGFGMLWRNDAELQNLLGWATGDEFGYSTNYEYHWGGTVNEANEYEAGPGYHLIETLNRTVYRFDEETRTWDIIRQDE
ncbi:MAG: hypothetical protein ACFE0Q_05935 [Anaerolineae bacterium]